MKAQPQVDNQPSNTSSRINDMLGTAMGPVIGELLNHPDVVEIMLNPDGKLWAEKIGQGMYDTGKFMTAGDGERIIRLIASSVQTECNADNPSLAATLPACGSRFQGFLPPIVSQPSFTIRKKALKVFTLEQYVDDKIMTQKQSDVIKKAVTDRENILVVGGTGTGKTTLTNAILAEISKTGHRIVTIEDTPELQCTAPNLLAFHARPPHYTMQHAVKDSLRSRPDRIIVGEVRDGSALDLLKGWNTGHNGGIATIHANGAAEGLTRVEQLIQEVVTTAPRPLIAQAIHVVIYIARENHGRRVQQIARVKGFKGDEYILEPYEG